MDRKLYELSFLCGTYLTYIRVRERICSKVEFRIECQWKTCLFEII